MTIGVHLTASLPNVGNAVLTNSILPLGLKSRVEPKATVFSISLAARYTQERCARLKGISSRSMVKKYWRKKVPMCSK